MLSADVYGRSTQVIVENHDYANRICNELANPYYANRICYELATGRLGHHKIDAISEIISKSDLARALHNSLRSQTHYRFSRAP